MNIFRQYETTAARRRVPIFLVDATDGITPETGEAGGQPQISKNGAAWANTSATLTAIGNGAYYVELTGVELDTFGTITIRYKSANTTEFNSTSQVVAFDAFDGTAFGLTSLPKPATTLRDGLIGHWLAGEDAIQSATVFDAYTGNHLVNNGSVSWSGSWAHFSGSNYLSARTNSIPAVDLDTLNGTAWYCEVDFDSLAGNRTIIGRWNGTGNQRGAMLWHSLSANALRWSTSADGSATTNIEVGSIAINTTYRILAQWKNGYLHLRVNDTIATPVAFAGPLFASTQDLHIGGQGPATNLFDGQMRNVGIWNRGLTADEESALFADSGIIPVRERSPRKVVLLMGQSNAVGRAAVSEITGPGASKRHYHDCWLATNSEGDFAEGNWSHTYAGFLTDTTDFGPEVGMAETLGSGWAIIKAADGATGLDDQYNQWEPGGAGVTYNTMVAYATAALDELRAFGEDPEVVGIVWGQGEKDSQNETAANAYEVNETALFAALRAAFADYGSNIHVSNINLSSAQSYTYLTTVRAAKAATVAADDNASLIDTDDLTLFDSDHYDGQSQLVLGRRVAADIKRSQDALAADAIAEIQSGLATSSALSTAQGNVTDILADTTELQADLANGGRIDLLIDAIKAVTDNMPESGALTVIDGLLDTLVARLTAVRAGYLDSLDGHTAQTGDAYAEVVKVPRASSALSAGRHAWTNHDNADETIEVTYGDPA